MTVAIWAVKNSQMKLWDDNIVYNRQLCDSKRDHGESTRKGNGNVIITEELHFNTLLKPVIESSYFPLKIDQLVFHGVCITCLVIEVPILSAFSNLMKKF